MLDVSRKTYLQTVEEIYEEASALGEKHGIEIKVHYSASRGYHLKVRVRPSVALAFVWMLCHPCPPPGFSLIPSPPLPRHFPALPPSRRDQPR